MSAPWTVAALLAVLLVSVLLAVSVRGRSARRAAARRAAADRAEVEDLWSRLAHLEARVAQAERARPDDTDDTDEPAGHVITVLGREGPVAEDDEEDPRPPATVPASLFADLVLREGVVQAAALAAGVRRALAPEQRHRVRLEMRREVKRARKQRRTEVREARRALADRQRSAA